MSDRRYARAAGRQSAARTRASRCRARRTTASSRARASSSTTSGGTAWATSTSSARRTPTRASSRSTYPGARGTGCDRDADGRRGRHPDRPVLPDHDPAGSERPGFRARGRQGALRSARPWPPSSPRRASSHVTPPSWSRSTTSPCRRSSTHGPLARRGRARPARGGRLEPLLDRRLRVGRPRRGVRRGRPRGADRRAPLRPLQLDAARVRRRARRVQPRHRTVDDHVEQPVPGLRRDHDGTGTARRARQAALRLAGHRRRLREQDHDAPAARRLLPARAQARPPRPVDRVAHGFPPVDVARERALVPRRRGRRQGGRHAARLPLQGARRRGRLAALRAARRCHLGAGDARDVPLAQHPASSSRR